MENKATNLATEPSPSLMQSDPAIKHFSIKNFDGKKALYFLNPVHHTELHSLPELISHFEQMIISYQTSLFEIRKKYEELSLQAETESC